MLKNLLPTIICFFILSSFAHAAYMNIEGVYFYEGDDIRVTYGLQRREPNELDFLEIGSEKLWGSMHFDFHLDRDKSEVNVKARDIRGGYKDYRVRLAGIEDFIRIREKPIQPLDGAISLISGEIVNYGDPIILEVNVPQDRVLMDPEKEDSFRYRIPFVEMPMPVTGTSYGQASMADDGDEVKESYMRIDTSDGIYRGTAYRPGFYRVQLIDVETVVDTVEFMIIAKPAPGALTLGNAEDLKIGDPIDYKVDESKLSPNIKWSVKLYRYAYDGQLIPSRFELKHSGKYVMRLVEEVYPDQYIMDQLTFEVSGRQEIAKTGEMYITTGDLPSYFRKGEKITVTYYFPYKPARGREIVLYKKVDRTRDERRAEIERDPVGQGDTVVRSWKPVLKKKQAFSIEGLPAGNYDLRYFVDPVKSKFHYASARFKVVARKGEAALDLGKAEFLWDEIINVNISLPEDMDPNSMFLFLELSRIGGYVPGCAIESDRIIKQYMPLKGKLQQQLRFEDAPGTYVVRLRDGDKNNDYGLYGLHSPVIAETEFKVTTGRFDEAISVAPGTVFEAGQEINVEINIPDSVGPGAMLDTSLQINRIGYNAPGGTVIPTRDERSKKIEWEGNRATVNMKIPGQGFYELWMRKQHNLCGRHDPCIIMARIPFESRHPDSPLRPEYGVWGGIPESNLGLYNPHPPIGEYLDPQTCGGPFELEAPKEKMELKFVRWDNGNYVEVTPPVDFGAGFYVQGQLEKDAREQSYLVTLTTPEGDEQEVALFPLEDDPTIVRSDRLYLIWHPEDEVNE